MRCVGLDMVMNAVYVAEIKEQRRELGLSPEVLTV